MVILRNFLLPLGVSFGSPLQEYRLSPEVHFPVMEEVNTEYNKAAYHVCSPMVVTPTAPASQRAIILHSVAPSTCQRAGLGIHGVGSVRGFPLHTSTPVVRHLSRPA